jgi:hypothetical protein
MTDQRRPSLTAPSLYQRVMGGHFAGLAEPIQRFHQLSGHHELHGWVETNPPATRLAALLARLLGTPLQQSKGPIRFVLDAQDDHEMWTRHFPTKTMCSRLSQSGSRIHEHLGACRLSFDLQEHRQTLVMRLRGLSLAGVPCPAWLMPKVIAEESGLNDQLHFKVSASLPVIGLVASYRGHLELSARRSTP